MAFYVLPKQYDSWLVKRSESQSGVYSNKLMKRFDLCKGVGPKQPRTSHFFAFFKTFQILDLIANFDSAVIGLKL